MTYTQFVTVCDSTHVKDVGVTPISVICAIRPSSKKHGVSRSLYLSQEGGLHVILRSIVVLLYFIHFYEGSFGIICVTPTWLTVNHIKTHGRYGFFIE